MRLRIKVGLNQSRTWSTTTVPVHNQYIKRKSDNMASKPGGHSLIRDPPLRKVRGPLTPRTPQDRRHWLNPEETSHKNLTDLSTSPVRYSHFTLGNPKKSYSTVLFIHRPYFWLITLSQKKTNYNPFANPIWKTLTCELQNFFHLTEGLLCSFKRWRLWKEPVVGCRRWLWKEPVVMCGNWNARQATSQQVFRVTTFCNNTCFQSFSTLISRMVHHAVQKLSPMSQQAAAASRNMSVLLHALLL